MMGCTCGRCTDWPPMVTPPGWEYLLDAWTCPACLLVNWTPYVGEPLIEMRIHGYETADTLEAVKALAADWRNRDGLRLRILIGDRRLTLGPEWRYGHDGRQLAQLAEFGTEDPRVVLA